MICRMDVFLVKLSLTIGHIATTMLPLIMNNLTQKYIHSGLTFVIKTLLIINGQEDEKLASTCHFCPPV